MKRKKLLMKIGCSMMIGLMMLGGSVTDVKAASSILGQDNVETKNISCFRTFDFNTDIAKVYTYNNKESVDLYENNILEMAKGEVICFEKVQIAFNYSGDLVLTKKGDNYYVTPKSSFTGETKLKLINQDGLVTNLSVTVNPNKIDAGVTYLTYNTRSEKSSKTVLEFNSTKYNVTAKSLRGYVSIKKNSNRKFTITAKQGESGETLLDIIQLSANGKKYYITVHIVGVRKGDVSKCDYSDNFEYTLGKTTEGYRNKYGENKSNLNIFIYSVYVDINGNFKDICHNSEQYIK